MSKPKVLQYDWEQLTGQEELDREDMDSLRLWLRGVMADCSSHKNKIVAFLNTNATYLLSKPTSDLAVCLYWLLIQAEQDRLFRFTAATLDEANCELSIATLLDLISDSFAYSKRSIPVVLGIPPRIIL
jgi:hypothetical protein